MDERSARTLRVTYKRSMIGNPVDQKATVKALGLRRLNQTVTLPDNASVRGMIHKVRHLVVFEEATGAADTAGE